MLRVYFNIKFQLREAFKLGIQYFENCYISMNMQSSAEHFHT